jgi:hypothetical protein
MAYKNLKYGSDTAKSWWTQECGINLTTAFNWRHRFLKLTDFLMSKQLEGIAEMDETQLKYSEKGRSQLTAEKPLKRSSDKAPKVKASTAVGMLSATSWGTLHWPS